VNPFEVRAVTADESMRGGAAGSTKEAAAEFGVTSTFCATLKDGRSDMTPATEPVWSLTASAWFGNTALWRRREW